MKLVFQSSPSITVATNTFINVPVILKYEDTPLMEVIKEQGIGFTTQIPIYHSDGTYLAKVKGNRIFPTEAGKKANVWIFPFDNHGVDDIRRMAKQGLVIAITGVQERLIKTIERNKEEAEEKGIKFTHIREAYARQIQHRLEEAEALAMLFGLTHDIKHAMEVSQKMFAIQLEKILEGKAVKKASKKASRKKRQSKKKSAIKEVFENAVKTETTAVTTEVHEDVRQDHPAALSSWTDSV